MASHDEAYRAGEAKGRAEEKTGQMMGTMRDKAEAVKDKTGSYLSDKADAAKQKASGVADATREKAEAARQKASEMTESAGNDPKNHVI